MSQIPAEIGPANGSFRVDDIPPERESAQQIGFLVILMGGTGLAAGRYIEPAVTHSNVALQILQLDTDPITAHWVNQRIPINMTATKLNALMSNPTLFGRDVSLIVRNYSAVLNPEDVENGSRTIRCLTQLCFTFHAPEIVKGIRQAILALLKKGVTAIIPLFLSSSGGGAGSALQVLLACAFSNPSFRAELLDGLPHESFKTPVSFVVEPFAYAERNRSSQANLILANAFAFRIESALLERQGAFKYLFHIGLASTTGVVLDTPEEIAKVLGTSVYQFILNYQKIKAQLVNNVDTNRIFRHYIGIDIPERLLHGRNGSPFSVPSSQNEHFSKSPDTPDYQI